MTIARRKRPNRVVFVLLAALALAFPAVAAAQTVVTGQMTATFDGEERTFPVEAIEQARLAEWPDKPR